MLVIKTPKEILDKEIFPLAKEKGITLLDAAWEYANGDEEMDTSWAQLYYVMQDIPTEELNRFNVMV